MKKGPISGPFDIYAGMQQTTEGL